MVKQAIKCRAYIFFCVVATVVFSVLAVVVATVAAATGIGGSFECVVKI